MNSHFRSWESQCVLNFWDKTRGVNHVQVKSPLYHFWFFLVLYKSKCMSSTIRQIVSFGCLHSKNYHEFLGTSYLNGIGQV
jgi:hypothetical protein